MNFKRVYWGIVLILLGVLGMGVTLGWFTSVNIWALIGPFFLIALGLYLLLRPRFPRHAVPMTAAEPILLEGAQEARIKIDHGAGKLSLSGGAGAGELLGGTFFGGLKKKVKRSGTFVELKLEGEPAFLDEGMDWDLRLTDAIPLRLDLDTGASELTCDLGSLKVVELKLDSGASSSRITLPAKAGYTLVDIDTGAASVELTVPEGVAASIKIDAALMKKEIDETRFPYNGDRYVSAGYDSAENKVEIKIDSAVGSIRIQ